MPFAVLRASRLRLLHTTQALDPVPGPPAPPIPTQWDHAPPPSELFPESTASSSSSSPDILNRETSLSRSPRRPGNQYGKLTKPKPERVAPVVSRSLPSHLPPLLRSGSSSSSARSLPDTVPSALDLLKSQSTPSRGIYLLARLHARTYLLHPRDILTLPRLKPLRPPGTTMLLTRVLEVGSRDYAIRSPAADGKLLRRQLDYDAKSLSTVPRDVASCEVTVLEHTRGTMMSRLKFKRRGGARKTVKSKPGWTRLRVGDIILGHGSASSSQTVQT